MTYEALYKFYDEDTCHLYTIWVDFRVDEGEIVLDLDSIELHELVFRGWDPVIGEPFSPDWGPGPRRRFRRWFIKHHRLDSSEESPFRDALMARCREDYEGAREQEELNEGWDALINEARQ